jgi:hypothetical protein
MWFVSHCNFYNSSQGRIEERRLLVEYNKINTLMSLLKQMVIKQDWNSGGSSGEEGMDIPPQ